MYLSPGLPLAGVIFFVCTLLVSCSAGEFVVASRAGIETRGKDLSFLPPDLPFFPNSLCISPISNITQNF